MSRQAHYKLNYQDTSAGGDCSKSKWRMDMKLCRSIDICNVKRLWVFKSALSGRRNKPCSARLQKILVYDPSSYKCVILMVTFVKDPQWKALSVTILRQRNKNIIRLRLPTQSLMRWCIVDHSVHSPCFESDAQRTEVLGQKLIVKWCTHLWPSMIPLANIANRVPFTPPISKHDFRLHV